MAALLVSPTCVASAVLVPLTLGAMDKGRVLILGGGPAGLSAAVCLLEKGFAVSIIEQKARLTEGPRSADTADAESVDSNPPIVLGCHHETRRMLTELGAGRSLQFPADLHLQFVLPHLRLATLPRLWGPALLRGPATVAGFTGLPIRDRVNLLNMLERLWEQDLRLPADLDARAATELWTLAKQSDATVRHIWTPLSRFLLGDEPRHVSGEALVSVLQSFFLGSRRDSTIGFVPNGLIHNLLAALESRVKQTKATLHLGQRATQVVTRGHRITALRCADGRDHSADWYLSTLSPEALANLLPERWLAQYGTFQRLTEWNWLPQLTVRLDYRLDKPKPSLLLRSEGAFAWALGISHKVAGTSSLHIWLVATGDAAPMQWSDEELMEAAILESRPLISSDKGARLVASRIWRHDKTLPALRPGTRRLRAVSQSPIPNLFLAGAWTDTGLPLNVESALVSGRQAAEAIARAASDEIDRAKPAH